MRLDEVKNKLMQFENKKYCDQIKMVCGELVEAGFAEKTVDYTRDNQIKYYIRDNCEFVFINLFNHAMNARQGIIMDKSVFESEGFAEKRVTLSLKSRNTTKYGDDRTLVPCAFSNGNITLHHLVMNCRSLPEGIEIDHITHYLGICTKDMLRACSGIQNSINRACRCSIDEKRCSFSTVCQSCQHLDDNKRKEYEKKGYTFKVNGKGKMRIYSKSFERPGQMYHELEIFEKEQFGAFRYNPSYDFSETFYAFVAWKMIGWGTETEITKYNRDYIIRNRPEVAKYYQLEECK